MQNKSKEIYDGMRRMTDKRATKMRVINDKNSKVLTDQDQVKKQAERTFSRVIQPTDCDRSICTHGDASGWSKLCQRCWTEERFPQLWTKSVVVPIHKKKDKLSCDNYRGVSLLSHCG